MKFSLLANFLSLVAGLVSAVDLFTPQLLRVTVPNNRRHAYEGFYVGSYHEGEGLADATIQLNKSQSLPGAFLIPTANVMRDQYFLNFNFMLLGMIHSTQVTMVGYDTLGIVTINSRFESSPGFNFNADGKLTYNNATMFAACQYSNTPDYPSIYFQVPYYIGRVALPTICTTIELQQEDHYLQEDQYLQIDDIMV